MAKVKEQTNLPQTAINRRLWLTLLGFITLIVVVCYGNTLSMGTVFNDRMTLVTAAAQAHGHVGADLLLRPLTQPWLRKSFLLDEMNYAGAFGWYHLVNVYFHWVCCAALFCLLFRLCWRWRNDGIACDPYKFAFFAAALFAAHPLAAEPATYISARYAVLGGCNYLLALNCFLAAILSKPGALRIWSWILYIAFAWMSFCSFDTSLSLPLMSLALLFLARPLGKDWKEWAVEHPIVCGLLIAISVMIPFSVILGFEPAAACNWYGLGQLPAAAYYATQAKALVTYYLRGAIAPIALSIDPPWAQTLSWFDPFAVIGVIVFGAAVGCLYKFRDNRGVVLGLAIALLGYLPHALLLQQEPAADAVFYMSLAGLCVLAGLFLQRLPNEYHSYKNVIGIVACCGLAILHNLDFRDDKTLIAQTLKVNAASAVAHTLAAGDALDRRKYEDAIKEADVALIITPDAPLPALCKGEALTKLGQYKEAAPLLTKAVDLASRQHLVIATNAKYALAENTLDLGKNDEAGKLVFAALTDDPKNPRGLYMLGMVAYRNRDYKQAKNFLLRAARQGVKDALVPMSEVSLQLHNFTDAFAGAQLAVREQDSNENQILLGNAAIGINQLNIAEDALTKVVKVKPHDPKVLALLSVVYERKGDVELSKSYSNDAIKYDPNIFSRLILPAPEKEGKQT